MSFLCCQWCMNIFSSEKSNKQQNKKAYRPSDIDEQQLIQHQNNNSKHQLPHEYFHQQPVKDLSHELNVELNLPLSSKQQQDHKSQTSSRSQNGSLNHKQQQDHFQQHQQQQQITQQLLKPNYNKFSINLDPYDKYYKLLHQKTQNLQQYFIKQGKDIQFGSTKSNLKIKKILNNIFQTRFQLPCSYSFYSMLIKDSNLINKKYMTLFQKHQILQSFKPNFTRNITKMKRFNLLQPREFIYLKYSNGSFRQNWEICINDTQDDLLSEQTTQHKRCDIFSVSNFKQINDRLYVRQYIQIDLKSNNMNINIWGKIMHQVRQYFQKLYLYVQKYYQKQLL